MTGASRLLLLMFGFSIFLHVLFITGLPHLPWFSRPPDIYRLTRYVVRFNKPVPTSVPMLTQVAVAEPIPIEPAPVEPLADLQTPKPIERVETLTEHTVEPLVAPAPVQPIVPKPPELQQRAATQTRQRVETRPEQIVKPQMTPLPVVQPVVPKPPELEQRAATQTRRRVETRPEQIVKPQVAPTPVVQPAVPKPPEVQQRVAARARQRVETPTEHVVKPQVAPAPVVQPVVPKPPELEKRAATRTRQRVETRPEEIVKPQVAPTPVKPVIPKPQEQRKQRVNAPREHVVVQEHQPRPDIVPIEPPQPVVVKPVPRRRTATMPRSHAATQTTGRRTPSRVATAVPQTVSPVPIRVAALSQPRQPSPAAILQAEREQLQAAQEQAEQDAFEHYKALVQQRLEEHSPYLQEVTERIGKSGRVVLNFTVRRDGEVIIDPDDVEFTHRLFRAAALRALRRVGQLPPFPPEIRRNQIPMEFPIKFQLEDR